MSGLEVSLPWEPHLECIDGLVDMARNLNAVHVPGHAPGKGAKEGQADQPPHAAHQHTPLIHNIHIPSLSVLIVMLSGPSACSCNAGIHTCDPRVVDVSFSGLA